MGTEEVNLERSKIHTKYLKKGNSFMGVWFCFVLLSPHWATVCFFSLVGLCLSHI